MDAFRDSRSLVVGGAGFVGSNLVRELLAQGSSEVLVVDNLLSSEAANLPGDPRVRLVEGSITDDAVLARVEDAYDYIFHLATYHGNQSSIADPLADHANNTLTTLRLCEHIRDFRRVKRVVYSSAGCTVAEKTYDACSATSEDAPVSLYLDSPYQISKVVGELYFNYYFMRYGMPVVKARFQNVYGPGEVLGAGRWRGTPATVWRNVIPTFIYRSLRGDALPVQGGGVVTRDFIAVADIVRGLMLCADRGRPGEAYNLASGEETSILDLAGLINELTGNPTPPRVEPRREWDRSGKRFGDTEKARRELGFTASVPLREGLDLTIQWTRANLGRIEACMARHAAQMAAAEG